MIKWRLPKMPKILLKFKVQRAGLILQDHLNKNLLLLSLSSLKSTTKKSIDKEPNALSTLEAIPALSQQTQLITRQCKIIILSTFPWKLFKLLLVAVPSLRLMNVMLLRSKSLLRLLNFMTLSEIKIQLNKQQLTKELCMKISNVTIPQLFTLVTPFSFTRETV